MLNQLAQPQSFAQANDLLLQGVLEGLTDGILILSDRGEWVYHNYYAYRICQQLNQGKTVALKIPEAIWQTCKALIESRDIYATQPVVMESEVAVGKASLYRIRVRWLTLDEAQHPYLAVLLEDRLQSSQNQALAEALLYNLSQRQTEVWLLRRAGLTYQQIAIELYIAVNTVKSHLKDIHLKKRMALDLDDQTGA
jgi:DNA-binding CsgD family transcriptional regulator